MLVLFTGAGLLLKSFLRMRAVNSGFRAENVLTMTVDLPVVAYSIFPSPITRRGGIEKVAIRRVLKVRECGANHLARRRCARIAHCLGKGCHSPQRTLETLTNLPGVSAAGAVNCLPPGDALIGRGYRFTIWNESTSLPALEICFRRKVLPSISITLKECSSEMNLYVKASHFSGSFWRPGL